MRGRALAGVLVLVACGGSVASNASDGGVDAIADASSDADASDASTDASDTDASDADAGDTDAGTCDQPTGYPDGGGPEWGPSSFPCSGDPWAFMPCPADMWCYAGVAPGCADPGACTPRPTQCLTVCPGVCGCDGKTYCNECVANAAGTGIKSCVPCPAPPDAGCDPAACQSDCNAQCIKASGGIGYCADGGCACDCFT